MGQIYNEVVQLIMRNNLQGRIEMRFIDVFYEDLRGYDSIRKMIERGFRIPILSIGGKIRSYSGPTSDVIFNDIKKAL